MSKPTWNLSSKRQPNLRFISLIIKIVKDDSASISPVQNQGLICEVLFFKFLNEILLIWCYILNTFRYCIEYTLIIFIFLIIKIITTVYSLLFYRNFWLRSAIAHCPFVYLIAYYHTWVITSATYNVSIMAWYLKF